MTEPLAESPPEPTVPTIFEALQNVMRDVQRISKKQRNTQQNYSFRGIDAVLEAVGPAFRRWQIVPVAHKVKASYRDVRTSNDKPSREVTVMVTYRFYGPGGDYVSVRAAGESMDFGDKGTPKAMSVAFRIALLQTLAIPTGDVEPDSQNYERADPRRSHGQQPPADDAPNRDNLLQVILTTYEEAKQIRQWTDDEKLAQMRKYLTKSLGLPDDKVWSDKDGILWDQVSPQSLARMYREVMTTIQTLRAQESPL